jgi:hypothetical protein
VHSQRPLRGLGQKPSTKGHHESIELQNINNQKVTYREHQVFVLVDGDANGGEWILIGRIEREQAVRVDLAGTAERTG